VAQTIDSCFRAEYSRSCDMPFSNHVNRRRSRQPPSKNAPAGALVTSCTALSAKSDCALGALRQLRETLRASHSSDAQSRSHVGMKLKAGTNAVAGRFENRKIASPSASNSHPFGQKSHPSSCRIDVSGQFGHMACGRRRWVIGYTDLRRPS